MNKLFSKLTLVALFLSVALISEAQTTFYENFDSYLAGDYMYQQASTAGDTNWRLWSNDPAEDALVSADYSMTPNNALLIQNDNDIVFYPGSYTSGRWFFSGHIYVVSGHTAYFNVMHNWLAASKEWACQVFFDVDGTARFNVGNVEYPFTYNHEEWLYFSLEMDIDNDLAAFWFNDTKIHEWPFHYTPGGTTGTNKFEAVDFFGWDDGTNLAMYYLDEVQISTEAIIRFENKTVTYDGSTKPVTVKTYPPNLAYDLTYNGGTTVPVEPGTYALNATITEPGYSGSASGTLTINKINGAVTISNTSAVYDGTSKTVTTSTSPGGLSVDLLYNGSPVLPVNAGTYVVEASINDAHYQGTATDTLKIAKAAAQIAFTDTIQTYTGSISGVTITTTPASLATDVLYNGSAVIPVNVGVYSVIATINDLNYQGTNASTFEIEKATAGINISDNEVTYDGSVKPVTVNTTPTGLTVNITYDGNTTAPVDAGKYVVVATINDSNYEGSVTDTLIIAKATPVINITDNDVIYDGSAKEVTVSTIPSGLAYTLTYDGSSTAPSDAGIYTVIVSIDELNYEGDLTDNLTISPSLATIVLSDLTYPFDGLQKGVKVETTPMGLSYEITYEGNTTEPSDAGKYEVVVNITETNYAGTETDTLVINKASAVVNITDLTYTYDATSKEATVTTIPSGLTYDIAYNGATTLPLGAGDYSVNVTVVDANYLGTESATLVIDKATAQVVISSTEAEYDGSPKQASFETLPSGLSINVTYEGSVDLPVNTGKYEIIAVIDDLNYEGSSKDTLTINKGIAQIEIADNLVVYDGNQKEVTVSTLPTGLSYTILYDGSTDIPADAGKYSVEIEIVNANYEGIAEDTLEILKAEADIMLTISDVIFDSLQKSVVIETVPSGLSTITSYNGDSELPVNAGTYIVETVISDENYFGTATDTLIILKADAELILSGATVIYNANPQEASVEVSPVNAEFSVTYNGTTELPVAAGSYVVEVIVTDINYKGSATDTLVIEKAEAELLITDLVSSYTGTSQSVSVSTQPENLAYEVYYAGSETEPIETGVYDVEVVITDNNYKGSTSTTMTINKASQTITWEQDLTGLTVGSQIDLTASASSGLEIVYSSGNTDVATISGTTLSVIGIGEVTITASQAGNSNYTEASELKIIVTQATNIEPVTGNDVEFEYWPNPVNDIINIELVSDNNAEIEIYNQAGAIVFNDRIFSTNSMIDLSELATGVYILKVKVGDNSKIVKLSKR